jgi:SAM-dependent methyltransferase
MIHTAEDRLAPLLTREHNQLRALAPNLLVADAAAAPGDAQAQTNEAFSRKWLQIDHGGDDFTRMTAHQRGWYLDLYGFGSERELREHLRSCRYVVDCGTGTGNKAAWFAELSPETLVVAVDISESVLPAAEFYRERQPNLVFLRADIEAMRFFADGGFDYVNCDQVIHHTSDPPATFRELVRLARPGGELTCYVYRKKALPRELLDEHFREYCKSLSHEDLMALSRQLTDLGRLLDGIRGEFEFPSIPALNIEGGRMSVQRFLYWNFIKCFWNEEMGHELSVLTNYDWYSPSQAARYSEAEFRAWVEVAGLEVVHFHSEAACYSGRFRRPDIAR